MKKLYNHPVVEMMQITADLHLCAGSSGISITSPVVSGGSGYEDPSGGL